MQAPCLFHENVAIWKILSNRWAAKVPSVLPKQILVHLQVADHDHLTTLSEHCWRAIEQDTEPHNVLSASPGQLSHSDTSPSMIACACVYFMFIDTLQKVYLLYNQSCKNSKFPSVRLIKFFLLICSSSTHHVRSPEELWLHFIYCKCILCADWG